MKLILCTGNSNQQINYGKTMNYAGHVMIEVVY